MPYKTGDRELPKEIGLLHNFLNNHESEDWLFSLYEPTEGEDLDNLVAEKQRQCFDMFLLEASGSQIGFWNYDTESASLGPIVFIDSAGPPSIIANDFYSFLQVVAVGYDSLNDDLAELSPLESIQNDPTLLAYRKWIKQKFNLDIPKDKGEAIYMAAKKSHPDLEEWCEQGYNDTDDNSENKSESDQESSEQPKTKSPKITCSSIFSIEKSPEKKRQKIEADIKSRLRSAKR